LLPDAPLRGLADGAGAARPSGEGRSARAPGRGLALRSTGKAARPSRRQRLKCDTARCLGHRAEAAIDATTSHQGGLLMSSLRWHRGLGARIGTGIGVFLLLPSLALADASADAVRRWNRIAIDASGLDHTPVAAGETDHVYGERVGPGRGSGAMAIVHVAVFEVVNALAGSPYRSYLRLIAQNGNASTEIAVAAAAHDTLVAMFPSQQARFDRFLREDLLRQPPRRLLQTVRGMLLGRRAASLILSRREGDGSGYGEPLIGTECIPSREPGCWRQDPSGQGPVALGAKWGAVTPFVLQSGDQFRAPPPPDLTSAEYAAAFHEVRALGGDGQATATLRSDEQTRIGIYWA